MQRETALHRLPTLVSSQLFQLLSTKSAEEPDGCVETRSQTGMQKGSGEISTSSLFCYKNVTETFYACNLLSNLSLWKALPVHNYRHGVEIDALLDRLLHSFITKNKQPAILDEDRSLSRQKIAMHLVILASASVAFSHLREEALQK